MDELQKFIQVNDIKQFKTLIKSFRNVQDMEVPLIQYCIMKNAIECFKYLLVNGYDDPNKIMEQNKRKFKHQYEWDCMATAIYFGNNEIIKILKNKGIETMDCHFEAAILSYRNTIAEEILNEMNEARNLLYVGLMSSARNNNIKGDFMIPIIERENLNSKIGHHFILQ